MIALDKLTDEQFERHALDVLDGLTRFLRLHRSGRSDYARERVDWQKDLTVDQIVESIRQRRV